MHSSVIGSVQVIHVQNGKAIEVWTHAADPYAAEQFWS